MPAGAVGSAKKPQAVASPTAREPLDSQARIAQRAYQIYEQRGDGPGSALDDWLQAEREVRTERNVSDSE
jgi:hypothetical protein